MSAQFKFPEDIRPHVESLAKLMQYANSRSGAEWCRLSLCGKSGVYGLAWHTVAGIIEALLGQTIAERSLDFRNFGGGFSWLDDIETAVTEAIEYEARRKW